MSGKLFVVGTPIGNLGDMSERAKQALGDADLIAAEDTRVTVKLLNKFGIKTPLISYHEHNKMQRREELAARAKNGESIALVTDAGMPAISDPGEDLVRFFHENGLPVESVPGPSALITALSISGMPCGRFCFEGFLSVNGRSRREHLESLKNEQRTMIFYEAPHKLRTTLADMLLQFGDREIALVKELTKLHETVERTTLSAACEKFETENPKGEYVLIVSGAKPPEKSDSHTFEEAVALAKEYIGGGMAASAAAKRAAAETGFKKSDIYKSAAGNS